MTINFDQFIQNLGVGSNGPVTQPKPAPISGKSQLNLAGNDIGSIGTKFLANIKNAASAVYNVGFKPGMEANQAVGQGIIDTAKTGVENYKQNIKLIANPETQKQFTENAGPLRQAAVNYTLAPLAQVPYNVKGALDKSKGGIERATSAGNAFLGAAQIIPGITGWDDLAFAIYNGFKGMKSSQLKGESFLTSLKKGKESLTGQEFTGLGEAATTNPTGQKILNVAELPLIIFGAGTIASKKKAIEQVVGMEDEILRTIKGIQNYDKFSPEMQMDIIRETIDTAKKVIPDIIKTDEMKKLSLRSPTEWMATVAKFIEDRLVSAKNPELNIGFNTRKLKSLPEGSLDNVPLKTAEAVPNAGPVLGPAEKAAANLALPEISTTPNAVDRIIEALGGAKPIRKEQEALYTAERSKRFAASEVAGQEAGGGQQGFFAQKGALKGELPTAEFEGVGTKLTQLDIDSLFKQIQDYPNLTYPEKLTAQSGLQKLLEPTGGRVPTEGEIKLLDEIFPPAFTKAILDKRPLMQKLLTGAEEVLNVPRALMASFDLSAPLRQGVLLVGRPKEWGPAFKDMFKYFASEGSYQDLLKRIQADPNYQLMREANLAITSPSNILSKREEAFMSNLAERIPGIGKIVRASDRAYSGFLSQLRYNTFNSILNDAKNAGVSITPKLIESLGEFVNTATGRGKLPKTFGIDKAAVLMNSTFFSPKLAMSRINTLNPAYYAKLDPFVRKQALKSLLSFAGIAGTVLSLAKLAGADVETESTSADFGKIKVGNTRYDILGGFQQYIRLASQLINNKITSSTTGVPMTLGEGYKPMTRGDVLSRFVQSKEAPVVTFATGLLNGLDSSGKPFDVKSELAKRFIPLVIQDLKSLIDEGGIAASLGLIPGIFGVGVQTYSSDAQQIVSSAGSVNNEVNKLFDQGKDKEAQALLDKNQVLLQQADQLGGLVDEVKSLQKDLDAVQADTRIPDAEKQQIIKSDQEQIDTLNAELDKLLKLVKQPTPTPGPKLTP